MWEEDKDSLKGILRDYSVQEVLRVLSEVSSELSDEMSDVGLKDKSKQLTILAVSVEDLLEGRPFLS